MSQIHLLTHILVRILSYSTPQFQLYCLEHFKALLISQQPWLLTGNSNCEPIHKNFEVLPSKNGSLVLVYILDRQILVKHKLFISIDSVTTDFLPYTCGYWATFVM